MTNPKALLSVAAAAVAGVAVLTPALAVTRQVSCGYYVDVLKEMLNTESLWKTDAENLVERTGQELLSEINASVDLSRRMNVYLSIPDDHKAILAKNIVALIRKDPNAKVDFEAVQRDCENGTIDFIDNAYPGRQ